MRLQILRDCLNDMARCASENPEVPVRFRAPLMGVAAVSDPLFFRLRRVVSPSHTLPEDLLPGARSVIAFFLPFDTAISASNRLGRTASHTWVQATIATNRLIAHICTRLADLLRDYGFESVTTPAICDPDGATLESGWSHMHVAFIAGLGRFGRHHMLITDAGCAGRFGSLVTEAVLPVTRRPRRAFCLAAAGQFCDACIHRCPAGALVRAGLDRYACHTCCLENARLFASTDPVDVCGKCVSGVPCADRNPTRAACHLLLKYRN